MVPAPLRHARLVRRYGTAAGCLALSLIAGCRGGAGIPEGASYEERVAALVQGRYTGRDAVAAGAWTWFAPDSTVWVLIDVQSAMPGVVQARAELWVGDTTAVTRVGRSDVMPAAAEFGAYLFGDITGDGLPDFFGYVADSAATRYPVFIPGAHGAMTDLLEDAGRGFTFSIADSIPPQVVAGPRGACALQLWADAVPDSTPTGWQFFPLGPRSTLLSPVATEPVCP